MHALHHCPVRSHLTAIHRAPLLSGGYCLLLRLSMHWRLFHLQAILDPHGCPKLCQQLLELRVALSSIPEWKLCGQQSLG